MTTLPLTSTAALATPITTPTAPNSSAITTNLASQNVFLQLLVAQLKNQDPQQPTDGTAFVTELAQFTTLQENTSATTDLDKIVAALPALTAAANAAAGTTKP